MYYYRLVTNLSVANLDTAFGDRHSCQFSGEDEVPFSFLPPRFLLPEGSHQGARNQWPKELSFQSFRLTTFSKSKLLEKSLLKLQYDKSCCVKSAQRHREIVPTSIRQWPRQQTKPQVSFSMCQQQTATLVLQSNPRFSSV
jgi:hypothetical protein